MPRVVMMRQPQFMERRLRSGRVRHHSGRGGILVHVLCAFLALSQASFAFAQQMTEEEKQEQKELEKLIGKEKDIQFKTESSDKGKDGFGSVKGDPKSHDPGTDPKTQEMIRTYEDQVDTTPGTKLDRAVTHRSSVHLEGELKKQVARLGGSVPADDIDQHVVFRPSEAAKTDAALKDWEKKHWRQLIRDHKTEQLKQSLLSHVEAPPTKPVEPGSGETGRLSGKGGGQSPHKSKFFQMMQAAGALKKPAPDSAKSTAAPGSQVASKGSTPGASPASGGMPGSQASRQPSTAKTAAPKGATAAGAKSTAAPGSQVASKGSTPGASPASGGMPGSQASRQPSTAKTAAPKGATAAGAKSTAAPGSQVASMGSTPGASPASGGMPGSQASRQPPTAKTAAPKGATAAGAKSTAAPGSQVASMGSTPGASPPWVPPQAPRQHPEECRVHRPAASPQPPRPPLPRAQQQRAPSPPPPPEARSPPWVPPQAPRRIRRNAGFTDPAPNRQATVRAQQQTAGSQVASMGSTPGASSASSQGRKNSSSGRQVHRRPRKPGRLHGFHPRRLVSIRGNAGFTGQPPAVFRPEHGWTAYIDAIGHRYRSERPDCESAATRRLSDLEWHIARECRGRTYPALGRDRNTGGRAVNWRPSGLVVWNSIQL